MLVLVRPTYESWIENTKLKHDGIGDIIPKEKWGIFLGKMDMNRKIPLNILPLKQMTQKLRMEAVIVTRECKYWRVSI